MNTSTVPAKQTKKAIRAELMSQIGNGQRMISGAEFEFGIQPATIDRAEFDRRCLEGNRLIMTALDRADEANVRLPY